MQYTATPTIVIGKLTIIAGIKLPHGVYIGIRDEIIKHVGDKLMDNAEKTKRS